MSKPKGETARRQYGRIAILERRMRQLVSKRFQTDSNIAEISAIEWAIPILEQYMSDKYGDMAQRVKWHKHEKLQIKSDLWDRDGQTCYLCNQPMTYRAATIDHVQPLAKGGKDDMSNYRLAHPLCNIQKGHLTLDEFRDAQARAAV